MDLEKVVQQFLEQKRAAGEPVADEDLPQVRENLKKEVDKTNALLGRFFRNLSIEAVQGRIPPAMARGKDMTRLLEVVHQRKRNFPCLIDRSLPTLEMFSEQAALQAARAELPARNARATCG